MKILSFNEVKTWKWALLKYLGEPNFVFYISVYKHHFHSPWNRTAILHCSCFSNLSRFSRVGSSHQEQKLQYEEPSSKGLCISPVAAPAPQFYAGSLADLQTLEGTMIQDRNLFIFLPILTRSLTGSSPVPWL